MTGRTTATFDPNEAGREIQPRTDGKLQVMSAGPMRVASLHDAQFTCECGDQLIGKRFDVINDHTGFALYVEGLCLTCETYQQVLYLGEPANKEITEESELDQLQRDIAQAVEKNFRRAVEIRKGVVAA